jgi:hypothetical protein
MFQTKHANFLEAELSRQRLEHSMAMESLRQSHVEEITRLELLHLDAISQHLKTLSDLKKAHAEEMARVIEENKRLWDDAERVRLYLTPSLQSVQTTSERLREENSPPPTLDPLEMGTPWERLKKKEWARQEAEARAADAKRKSSTPAVATGVVNADS